jgi:exosortase A-associated hydrolase 1/exosortase A-associated hydrolase 2
MSLARPVAPVSFLIPGVRGDLHACYFAPEGTPHAYGDLLFVPPFGEEMNRSRAMVALQAREFARIGIGTLIVDPIGTGDSAGDFVDATWDLWRSDLQAALAWLRANGRDCRAVWGMRLGALMASQLAGADPTIGRMLLWQPVFDGKQFFTQFLRIRIAAEMNLPDRVKTTGELRARCAAGESIEVSGYRVGAELARQLDQVKLDPASLAATSNVDWFEVLPGADADIPVASRQLVDRLGEGGCPVELHMVHGPAFWHVHERELAPELVEATTKRLQAWNGPDPSSPSTVPLTLPPVADAPERPLAFDCNGDRLMGVLHKGADDAKRGVVIVVAGGPQYRAGAHRQFVTLARRLAQRGYPVLRYDLRGMGDSNGAHRGYTQSEPDIRAAIDALTRELPALTDVVLLGECESASGILFYAWRDARVLAAVLINPWVRTEEGRAQVIVRHYYLHRLLSADFWKQMVSGRYRAGESMRSLIENLQSYARGRVAMRRQSASPQLDDISGLPLPVRVAEGLRRFRGRSLLLMSGFDLIAREFDEVTSASKAWEGLLKSERLRRVDVDGADHTFSREVWKNAAAAAVADWIQSLDSA